MVKHAVAIVAIMLIIDALVLAVTFIGFWNDIVPLNIVGTTLRTIHQAIITSTSL